LLISTEALEYGGNKFFRNYDKFLQETSENMENFYQKPEMDGRGSSETTANFYKKSTKIWKISTRNLKWREEVPPKLRQISIRNLPKYGKFLPET